MEEPSLAKVSDHLLTMDQFLLQQLAVALRKEQNNGNLESLQTDDVRKLLSQFASTKSADHLEKRNADSLLPCKQSKELGNNFGQNKESSLMVLNKDKCIHASQNIFHLLKRPKEDVIGKTLNDLFHIDALNKFGRLFSNLLEDKSIKDKTEESGRVHAFDVRMTPMLKSSNECNNIALHCICMKQNSCKELSDIQSSTDANSEFLICLMTKPGVKDTSRSYQVPPNHTVTSRGEIPQPGTFTTKQTITGKITGIDFYLLLKTTPKAEVNDLVKRCLRALQSKRNGGNSLYQILHKQVLRYAQAASPMYKFRLSDGTMATAHTKSKLMGNLGQPGEPPFVVSEHSIYREGKSQGLNVESLSPKIRNILSGHLTPGIFGSSQTPLLSHSSSLNGSESNTTSSNFVTSPMNTTDLLGDLSTLTSWPGSVSGFVRPRNSAEVARELLASTGAQGNPEDIVNGVLSPPPHLDGHLVHTVGRPTQSNQTNSCQISTSGTSKTNTTNNDCDDVTNNLATYPGPPCVDLSCVSKADQTLPPCTTSSLPSPHVTAADTSSLCIPTHTSSSMTSRARSASMNSSIATSVCLPKRSISNPPLGEDDVTMTSRETRLSKAEQITKQSKLLTQLLSDKNVPVSKLLCNRPLTSNKCSNSMTSSNANSTSALTSLSTSSVNKFLTNDFKPEPTPSTTSGALMHPPASGEGVRSCGGGQINPPNRSEPVPTRTSVTTNLSKEEWDELADIFGLDETNNNVFNSLAPSSSQVQGFNVSSQMPHHNGNNGAAFGSPPIDINNNHLDIFSSQSKVPPPMYDPENTFQQQSLVTSQLPTQQGSMTPMYQGAVMASVPVGLEPCPNRVVGSVSPRIRPTVSSTHMSSLPQYPGFPSPDIWEGKEPLVDLGSYPLPQGVNPRMAIPVPSNLDNTRSMHSNKNLQMTNHIQNDSMPFHLQQRNPSNLHSNLQQGLMQMGNTTPPSNPGGFPTTHVNQMMSNQMESPVRGTIRHQHLPRQPMQGGMTSPLRRQLQIRLNHPQNNFDNNDMVSKQGNLPPYPQQRNDVIGSNQNDFFINQKRFQNPPDMSRYMAPSNGHMSAGMRQPTNNQHFITSSTGLASPSGGYPRLPTFGNRTPQSFSPKGGAIINGDPRPVMQIAPSVQQQQYSVNPNQSNIFHYQQQQQSSSMTSPGSQLSDIASPPMTSQSPKAQKKSRPRKQRKGSTSKQKPDLKRNRSTDDVTSPPGPVNLNIPGSNLASTMDAKKPRKKTQQRRPMLQMTIGSMHQRPQATFSDGMTPPLDDAPAQILPNPASMNSSEQFASSRPRTLNLNNLLNQYKHKQEPVPGIMNFGDPIMPSPSNIFSNHNNNYDFTNNQASARGATLHWPDDTIDDVISNSSMISGSNSNSLAPPSDFLLPTDHTNLSENTSNLFLGGGVGGGVRGGAEQLNSNLNNNNIPPRRFIASVASLPTSSPPDLTSQGMTLQPQSRGERKTSLLESLLLKKDSD